MNLSTKKILFGVCIFLYAFSAVSQTVLQAGDIAIIGFNSDNPDQFLFTPLVDLEPGTEINFTDNGWNGSQLITVEGTITWTAENALSKGSIVKVTSSVLGLSVYGDQIFAYQGPSTSPNFIFGLSTNPWVNTPLTTKTSKQPASLTDGLTCIAFPNEIDNGYFNVENISGTKEEILAAICTESNWTRSNWRFFTFPNWNIDVQTVIVVDETEPLAQVSNIILSDFTTYSGNVSFTGSELVEGYIMIVSQNAPLSELPADGTTYTIGESIGNGKVVSLGTSTSIIKKGLRANIEYYFTALSYIDASSAINYRQADPAVASITTPSNMIGSYYSNIDDGLNTFVSDLQSTITSPHVKVPYGNYDETMVTEFEFRDTTNNQKIQECAYSGFEYVYTPPFVWYTTSPFSREHTWAVSWMPSSGSSSSFEYQDQHHLFTVVQNNANGVRSNHPLGDVVTATNTYLDGQLGLDASGNLVYEPRDEQKGDAARALLYMALRYDGVNGLDWSFDYLNNVKLPSLNEDPQNLNTLLSWHQNDPPDDYEMSRNDYIQSIQQNRNPFVDHPEWVDAINFNSLTWISPENRSLVIDNAPVSADFNFKVFPNPASNQIWLTLDSEMGASTIEIFDVTGRLVSRYYIGENAGEFYEISVEHLVRGTYIIRHSSPVKSHSTRLIKQ